MVQQFQPKPISLIPPNLKNKFVAPDNPRDMGTLVMLIGFAVIMVSSWNNISEAFIRIDKRSAAGEFVATAPFRSNNKQRMVGVYIFKDEGKIPVGVRGDRVFVRRAKVPRSAYVVWPPGRPQKARVVGEYYDHLLGLPVGSALLGFGLWLRRKSADLFEQAMNSGSSENETKAL